MEQLEHDVIVDAVKQHEGALAFIHELTEVFHVWDDLVDRDKPVSDARIHECFWRALVSIPGNAFYRQNESVLRPIIVTSIVNWLGATHMERDPRDDDLGIAFIVRSSYIDIVTMCAVILGGREWAASCVPKLRRFVHGEGFTAYLTNLASERLARDQGAT